MGKPAYPELLKKAKWDKEKGVIAKMTKGETGVGAALDGVLAAYTAIPWANLEDSNAASAKSAAEAAKLFSDGRAILNGQIEAARKKLLEASRLGSKVAADFKGKSAGKYLADMSNAAVNFATQLRDEAIEELKKLEAHSKAMAEFESKKAEVKKLGEEYIANRKAALAEMNGLKKLFIDTKAKLTTAADQADKLAKAAVATPATAAKAVTEITKLSVASKTAAKTANDKYATDGSVNTNKVQAEARGNIGKMGNPMLDKALQDYQAKSNGEFNSIMAVVAEILTIQKQFDSLNSAIETSLEIAQEATGAGTKSLQDYQKSAATAGTAALNAGGKAGEEFGKISKRLPLLEGVLRDAKAKPETVTSAHSTFETSITELNRRYATMENSLAQCQNFLKRFSALPPNVQSDGVVKGELGKINGAIKNLEAALKQAKPLVDKAVQMQKQLPPKK